MSPTIAFIVNGTPGSAMGIRSQSLATYLEKEFQVRIAFRSSDKVRSTLRFIRFLKRVRPDIVYVFDMSASGILAALLYKLATKTPVVVDTGDVISELSKSMGRGRIAHRLTVLLEWLSQRSANHLVVRGSNHRRLLQDMGIFNVSVIHDGVDTAQFLPGNGTRIRNLLGLGEDIVLGTLGSSEWNEKLQTCYGWEMLDVVHRLHDHPLQAVMIGGGSGITRMQERAEALGIADRVHFIGYVPYDELPDYLNAIDICLSKQTNDLVGQVRTTGKLPLYMACGRYVLATKVGEAEYVLPESNLIPFEGTNDPEYVDHLTDRVSELRDRRSLRPAGTANRKSATERFDYSVLGARLSSLLSELVPPTTPSSLSSDGSPLYRTDPLP